MVISARMQCSQFKVIPRTNCHDELAGIGHRVLTQKQRERPEVCLCNGEETGVPQTVQIGTYCRWVDSRHVNECKAYMTNSKLMSMYHNSSQLER